MAKRHRGHAPWAPTPRIMQIVNDAIDVLQQYVPTYGPMTLRQIFYRLVATTAYPKEDNAKNLSNYLVRARRAKLIDWDDMRDDRGTVEHARGWESIEEFLATIDWRVKTYALRGSLGQPYRFVIWCEAAGMVGMVAKMIEAYGIEVRSKSGFDGAGAKRALAVEIMQHYQATGEPMRLMHLGDADKAGRDIFGAFREDLEAYFREDDLADCCVIERVALTDAQIDDLGIELDVDGNAQLEAIDPPDLQRILVTAIEALWDRQAHAEVLARQERDRSRLVLWLAGRPA